MPRDNLNGKDLLDPLVILYAYKQHINLLHCVARIMNRTDNQRLTRVVGVMEVLTVRALYLSGTRT